MSDRVLWTYDKRTAYVPSPILHEGLAYLMTDKGLLTRTGDAFVVKAGPQFELVRTNPPDEPISASSSAAPGRLFIRGERYLFAIGLPAGGRSQRPSHTDFA